MWFDQISMKYIYKNGSITVREDCEYGSLKSVLKKLKDSKVS
jgi:hypothetical protein